jgi:UrcA family protein
LRAIKAAMCGIEHDFEFFHWKAKAMNISRHGRMFARALLGVAAFAGIQASAIAQTQDPAASTDIVVEAPRTLPPPKRKSAHSINPSVVATVRMMVLYNDLDLSKPDQAARLLTRIGRTARDACAYLDQMYPLVHDAECVSRAVDGATPAAKAAIEAKRKQ